MKIQVAKKRNNINNIEWRNKVMRLINTVLFLLLFVFLFTGCNNNKTSGSVGWENIRFGKNLTINVSETEVLDAEYLRKILDGEVENNDSVFSLWDSKELTKMIDYMRENDLMIAAGQYSFNQACKFENGFFILNNNEKKEVFKFIKKKVVNEDI